MGVQLTFWTYPPDSGKECMCVNLTAQTYGLQLGVITILLCWHADERLAKMLQQAEIDHARASRHSPRSNNTQNHSSRHSPASAYSQAPSGSNNQRFSYPSNSAAAAPSYPPPWPPSCQQCP